MDTDVNLRMKKIFLNLNLGDKRKNANSTDLSFNRLESFCKHYLLTDVKVSHIRTKFECANLARSLCSINMAIREAPQGRKVGKIQHSP